MGASSTKNGDKNAAIIKLETWSRESHGLFDYENNNTNKKVVHVSGTSSMFRTKFNEIICLPEIDGESGYHKNDYPSPPILHFLRHQSSYWIYHKNTIDYDEEDPVNRLWHVIKFYRDPKINENCYHLTEGDVVKLGRVRFKVTEMHRGKFNPKASAEKTSKSLSKKQKSVMPKLNNYLKQSNLMKKAKRGSTIALRTQVEQQRNQILNSKNSLENTNADQIEGLKILKRASEEISQVSEQQIGGRICLGELDEEEEKTNPIISPCKCSGTMKYIHTEGLKSWLNSKCITNKREESDGATSYIWKSLDGELGKTKFPDVIALSDRGVDLFEIQKPEGPYIILENVSAGSAKAVHVLGLKNREIIRIGRGHNCDIRIGDISVSRLHAIIK